MNKLPLIIFVSLLPLFARAEIRFTASTAAEDVPVNECVHLTITAQWLQNGDQFLVLKPSMPAMSGLKVADYICFNETVRCASQTVHRVVHQFKLAVTNQVGQHTETGPIYVEYRSFHSPDTQHSQLAGISYTILPARSSALTGTIIAVGSLGILGMCIVAVGVSRSSRRKNSSIPQLPAIENNFLSRLQTVKQYQLDGDIPAAFHEMESLLRRYFRDKYQIGAIEEWHAPESGPAGPDERTLAVARDVLALSHRVRYADYLPSAHEQHRFVSFLKTLLQRNQPRSFAPEEELYLKSGE